MHQLITLFRRVTLAFEARFFKAELINVNNEFYYTIGKLPSEKVVQNRSKLSKFEKNSGHCTHIYVATDQDFTWKRRGEITQIFTANSFTKCNLCFVKIGKPHAGLEWRTDFKDKYQPAKILLA